jgi:hypothetical protein
VNADSSYNSEAGWGGFSNNLGTFIGSDGGVSQFEIEPAYHPGVQPTGFRTIPDVSKPPGDLPVIAFTMISVPRSIFERFTASPGGYASATELSGDSAMATSAVRCLGCGREA